ncbi:hypothetical protein DL768_003858 [Monosporascus sp. mg162]|nr:hypothetical protein DL768_003858 [Monosporascus sp. mg162]
MEDGRTPDPPEEGDADLAQEDDGCVWIPDDFPLYGPASNGLSGADREIIDYFVPIRDIVTKALTYYVYCRRVASWSQMESDSAPSELLAVGNINAPVNSERALPKIYPLLKRIAYPIAKLDKSVCVGTWRLTPRHTRMYTFVTSPTTMPYPFASPVKVPVSADDRVINSILKPLRGDQKLDFPYRMYRELVDLGVDPSVIVFYGPSGHEGKTTLAKNLTMLLVGAVTWPSDDLVGHKSKWPSADLVTKLCEKRVLTCDECEIEDGFSYQHVRRWTRKAAGSNSIGRRLVIYDMRKDLGLEKPVDRSEITNSVILKFLSPVPRVRGCVQVYADLPRDSHVHHVQEEHQRHHGRDRIRRHEQQGAVDRGDGHDSRQVPSQAYDAVQHHEGDIKRDDHDADARDALHQAPEAAHGKATCWSATQLA